MKKSIMFFYLVSISVANAENTFISFASSIKLPPMSDDGKVIGDKNYTIPPPKLIIEEQGTIENFNTNLTFNWTFYDSKDFLKSDMSNLNNEREFLIKNSNKESLYYNFLNELLTFLYFKKVSEMLQAGIEGVLSEPSSSIKSIDALKLTDKERDVNFAMVSVMEKYNVGREGYKNPPIFQNIQLSTKDIDRCAKSTFAYKTSVIENSVNKLSNDINTSWGINLSVLATTLITNFEIKNYSAKVLVALSGPSNPIFSSYSGASYGTDGILQNTRIELFNQQGVYQLAPVNYERGVYNSIVSSLIERLNMLERQEEKVEILQNILEVYQKSENLPNKYDYVNSAVELEYAKLNLNLNKLSIAQTCHNFTIL